MDRWTHGLAPSATRLIRMDHSHVLALFRQVQPGTSPGTRRALVRSACLALEIHAQLEEELFYPALRALGPDLETVEKSPGEHDAMRRLIARLDGMAPTDAGYDAAVLELMRDVLHHVADEETTLLPAAERLLPERLGELGARMLRRRLELSLPRAGELAWHGLRAPAQTAFAATVGLLALGGGPLGRGRPQ